MDEIKSFIIKKIAPKYLGTFITFVVLGLKMLVKNRIDY